MFSFTINSIGVPFQELKRLPVKTTLREEEWELDDLVFTHHPSKGMILQGFLIRNDKQKTFVPLDKVSVKTDCVCIHMDLVQQEPVPENALLFSQVKNATIYTKDGKALSKIDDAIIQADITIDLLLERSKSLFNRFKREPKEQGEIILNTRFLENISNDIGMLSREYSQLSVSPLERSMNYSSESDMREYRDNALHYVEKIEPITTRKNM